MIEKVKFLKNKLKDQVVILAHHYQTDEIIELADVTGDSLELAQKIKEHADKKYIIFCGVYFMAETADILCNKNQTIILPDINAGCFLADTANIEDVEKAWTFLTENTQDKIIPITYINSSASIKSFVGKNQGTICTSSNAEKIIRWSFKQGKKLFFLPDQNLGRNICYKLGIDLKQISTYNCQLPCENFSKEKLAETKVILWKGYCDVHQLFNLKHIEQIKKTKPNTKVIVHPECPFEVFDNADYAGSTTYIINNIKKDTNNNSFSIGTEKHLVERLARQFPEKDITSLNIDGSPCKTMEKITLDKLYETLKQIETGSVKNVIKVNQNDKKNSLLALRKMLELSQK